MIESSKDVEAIESKPNRRGAVELYDEARTHADKGDAAAALIPALQMLDGRLPRPSHFEFAARLLYDLGMMRVAELVTAHALELGIEKASMHALRARALNRLKEHAAALEEFEKAVVLAPDNEGWKRFRDKLATRVNPEHATLPEVDQ